MITASGCRGRPFAMVSQRAVAVGLPGWVGYTATCHCRKTILHLIQNNVNTLRPRRNEQHFADDIFKRIFFNENAWISIKISLKFVPKGPINNIPALVQIMAWRRSGDKPLSESMMVRLPTHICVTRPQWVKYHTYYEKWRRHIYIYM